MKKVSIAALALGLLVAPAVSAEPSIEIRFAPSLERAIGNANRIERRTEGGFRKALGETSSAHQTAWAGERLIPVLRDFTVENLTYRLVEDNLLRAGIETDDRLRIEIRALKVTGHPVAGLNAPRTYVTGIVERFDPDGRRILREKVRADFVINATAGNPYHGEKYPFTRVRNVVQRVGPAMSFFVEKALETAYPEHSEQFEGPVLIKLGRLVNSGP